MSLSSFCILDTPSLPIDKGFSTFFWYLYENHICTDVEFHLETANGIKEYHAHKLILSLMSPVFAERFYKKGKATSKEETILEKNLDAGAFEEMLRFIYGSIPQIKSPKQACNLYQIASKFEVASLQELCHQFLHQIEVEPSNVFAILNVGEFMQNSSLTDKCFGLLQEKTREVINAYAFCDVTTSMMHIILKLPSLSLASEYELLKWVFSWAKEKAGKRDSVCSNVREALREFLPDMQFLLLSVAEFTEICRDNDRLFTSDEIASIFMNIGIPGSKQMPDWYNKDHIIRKYPTQNENTKNNPEQNRLEKSSLIQNDVGETESKLGKSVIVLSLNGPELTKHEVEKKTRPLIDEFLYNKDFEEAENSIMKLASPGTIYLFIYFAVQQVVFERSSQARYLLGQLLYSLVKKEIITIEQYNKGFSVVLENMYNFAVETRFIWEFVGDILAPMIEENRLPLSFLKDVLKPCIPSKTAGKLVAAVLHCAAKKRGTVIVGELWKKSGLQWSDFLKSSTSISKFIKTHKLQFTVSQSKNISKTGISMEGIRTNLKELLQTNAANLAIMDYIKAEVSRKEPSFIRVLTEEVIRAAIADDGKLQLNLTVLWKRIPLLILIIDNNETLELQALYAVQHLMNDLKYPEDFLRKIFDELLNNGVITKETFRVWESSEDPAEMEGKAEALNLLRDFFTEL